MTTGQQIVELAMTQSGNKYVFGVENDSRTVETASAWDCSELVQIICRQLDVRPVMPDGAYWQWRHCRNNNTMITVDEARRIPGALLFIGTGTGTGRDAIWHVAISRGDNTTIEARSTRHGTGTWPIGDRFTFAALIPGVNHHTPPDPQPSEDPDMAETYLRITDKPERPGDWPEGALIADNGVTATHLNTEDWRLIEFLAQQAGKKIEVTPINQVFARHLQRRRVITPVGASTIEPATADQIAAALHNIAWKAVVQ